jgi:hypothetical protein
MKLGESIPTWCAIFIGVLSLVFSSWQGCRMQQQGLQLNEKMVQTAEVNQGILRRLDYFEVWKIRDKLGGQQANIYMNKWRDYAESRSLIRTNSALAPEYEVSQLGHDLVNALEMGVLKWLRDRRRIFPEEQIQDVLSAINMSEWYDKLREYNMTNSTSFPLEAVFGVLVAYVDPNCSDLQ